MNDVNDEMAVSVWLRWAVGQTWTNKMLYCYWLLIRATSRRSRRSCTHLPLFGWYQPLQHYPVIHILLFIHPFLIRLNVEPSCKGLALCTYQ
jgi:hypothetical protein